MRPRLVVSNLWRGRHVETHPMKSSILLKQTHIYSVLSQLVKCIFLGFYYQNHSIIAILIMNRPLFLNAEIRGD
jgi:hypothetical protein